MLKLLFLAILPLVALTSCATSYQKEGIFTNGYSNSRSSRDTFTVTFRANEQTPPEKVKQYALKRASELTLRHGFRYFAVLEEVSASRHMKNKDNLHYPSVRLTIQCFAEKPSDRDTIDARQFL